MKNNPRLQYPIGTPVWITEDDSGTIEPDTFGVVVEHWQQDVPYPYVVRFEEGEYEGCTGIFSAKELEFAQ